MPRFKENQTLVDPGEVWMDFSLLTQSEEAVFGGLVGSELCAT